MKAIGKLIWRISAPKILTEKRPVEGFHPYLGLFVSESLHIDTGLRFLAGAGDSGPLSVRLTWDMGVVLF
jgi:hypothetical protein